MTRERMGATAVAEEIDEAQGSGSVERIQGWIAALEADQLRLARANEERTARTRRVDLRYLEFVREVLR